MTNDPHEDLGPRDPASQVPRSLEDGLAAAFGPLSRPAAEPGASVLQQLAARSGVNPRITLRDEHSQTPSKILRPLGPKGAGWPTLEGKYQLQGEIARGGVGVVLKGHDVDLGRDVAMKFLHEKYLDNPDLMQRFVEEAQIGGQLQHPGIVPVYDLGLSGARPYFTMKLVKGRTLAALFEERSEPGSGRQRLLGIFEQVCQTIAYAHARGVIHRDLKPANIMVGAFGEVQVVDWGMGKVLFAGGTADEERAQKRSELSVIETVRSQPGSGSTHSIVGSVMGTPAYMPPEQANGDVDRMDERSDVFALGAILCEILTGKPPYVGKQEELMVMAAKAQLEPCKERLSQCDAGDELCELCADCLMPVAATRPRGAEAVAARIAGYLAAIEERARNAQIEAAEERVRASAALRSHRQTLALVVSVLVTLMIGGGGFWWIERDAQARRTAADRQVAGALNEVSALLGEARAAGLADLTLWDRVASATGQAAKLAQTDDLPEERVLEVRAMQARVSGERMEALQRAADLAKEERMHERLIQLCVPPDEDVRGEAWPEREAERLDREYGAAFAEYLGGQVIQDEVQDDAVATLAAAADPVELAAALDHWAIVRDMLVPAGDSRFSRETAHLRAIAARIDAEDPWRSAFRSLLPELERNRAAIERQADEADPWSLPTVSTVLLGEALWKAGAHERAVEVYRRGREAHPADFGLCIRLGILLERLDDPPLEEVIELLRIANALRPEMREVLHRQIMALESLGRYEEALSVCADWARLEPGSDDALLHRRISLVRLGRWNEILEVTRLQLDKVYTDPSQGTNKRAFAFDGMSRAQRRLGRFEDALESCRRALEIVESVRLSQASPPSTADKNTLQLEPRLTRRFEQLEALIQRRPLLEEILQGTREPVSGEEWLEAADLAFDLQDYALAARTCRDAFHGYHELRDKYDARYWAVRVAALSGAGAGRDAGQLDGSQRAVWREQAVSWLSAELEVQAAHDASADSEVISRLDAWLRDPDLAGLRTETAIAKLPPGERAECRRLWAAVRVQLEILED